MFRTNSYRTALAGFLIVFIGIEVIGFMGARVRARRGVVDCAVGSVDIGTTCPGGAIYAGIYSSQRYMITPGGCAHEPSGTTLTYPIIDFTPSCSGTTDTTQKAWREANTPNYDIPGVETVGTVATAATVLGDVNTAAIGEITEFSDGGYHPAARYCDKLNYGGYSDWYLPSKSELTYVLCKTRTSGSGSYPHEDPNCASIGYGVGTKLLKDFAAGTYYSSTELSNANAHTLRFTDGFQGSTVKTNAFYLRCIRRVGPDFVGTLTPPTGYDISLNVSNLNVDYTANPESTAQTITIKNQGDKDATGVTISASAGFTVVGGTCGPTIAVAIGATCTINVKGSSVGRWENANFTGTLTLSNLGKSSRIGLAGATVNLPDPCYRVGAPVGALCNNGTYFGGQFDGGDYMVTPSGCGYEPSGTALSYPTDEFTPTCSGNDTLLKRWNQNGSTLFDIPTVENVAAAATKSSSSYRGNVNTREIVSVSALTEGGYHPAALYCDRLQLGGFQDWYLPSKSELTYLACRSKKAASNVSYPAEDPNCATYGYASVNAQLKGFVLLAATNYHSSTEQTLNYDWTVDFQTNNAVINSSKSANYYVRCIRRMGPHFIASPPIPGVYDVDAVVTGLNVNYLGTPESTAVTVTVKNQGDLSSTGVTASVSPGFAITGGTCSSIVALAVGQTCTIDIKGTSASRWYNGAITGTLTLSDNDRVSYVALSGTTTNLPDPCSRASYPIGVVCNDGTIYVGTFAGGTYRVTPGNCAYEPSGTATSYPAGNFTPTCDGTNDTMTKSWKGTGGSDYDIPGIENIALPADPSTVLGSVNTPIAAAITAAAEGGYHPAARYCESLSYGGYTDWYLPSKSEMAFLLCRSQISASGVAPAEDPGCATAGYGSATLIMPGSKKSVVLNFLGSYWVSTERTSALFQHAITAGTLVQNGVSKNSGLKIRCVRRY